MKKILLITLAVFIFSPAFAGIKIAFNDFTVENADANIRFYTDSLFGARGDGLRQGGTVSTLDFHTSFTSYNPACLAFQAHPMAAVSGIPFEFFGADLVGFITNNDFNSVFGEMLENFMAENTTPVANVVNPKFYLAQANGATGLEGVLPFAQNNAAIGVAREEKAGLQITLLGDGIKSSIDITDDANTSFIMTLTATAGAAADLNMKSIVTSIGIGRKIHPQWGIGAVLEYVDTRLLIDANAQAQAVGQYAGTSFEYNTNTTNSLAQYLNADLEAAAWALRVGTSFHAPDDVAEIAVDFSIQPRFTFNGEINGVAHTLPSSWTTIAQDFSDGETTTIEDKMEDYTVIMKLPSFFRTTLAWKPASGAVVAFNYTYAFDDMSLTLDGPEFSAYYSNVMRHSFRLGLNSEYFQLGGGFILSSERIRQENKLEKSGSQTDNELIIPVASVGCVIPMGDNVTTEWEFVAFPMPVMKASLTIIY